MMAGGSSKTVSMDKFKYHIMKIRVSAITILALVFILWSCEKDESTNFSVETKQIESTEEEVEETDGSEEEGDGSEESSEEEQGSEEEPSQENEAGGEVEEPGQQALGLVSYRGRIPDENSKVPSCKEGTPDSVIFVMTDSDGVSHEESVPATESGGVVTTVEPAPMPLGQSTVNEILLMQGTDTLYSIPNEDELDLARYADVTVPFQVEVTGNTELTGKAFCYNQQEIDVPEEELVDGGFGTQRLQTLWIDVEGECIDIITVTIDNYRVLEIYPFQDGLYDIPIPENYDRMDVRAYTPEYQGGVNDFEVFTFTAVDPYNADRDLNIDDLVKFSYDCPPEEDF